MLVPNPSSSALLAPDRLAEQAADAVRELLAEAAAANTTRSYATALRYWAGWFQGRFGQPITLPVPEPAVVQFVVDHLARRGKAGLTWELPPELDTHLIASGLKQKLGPFKLSTVVHRVAVLSAAHQAHKAANPCEAPAVRQLLKRGRRASVKRGERPHKKTAITRSELEALLVTCDDSLEGLRDKALLLFGFASGGRRRSEIAAANWQDLRRIGDDAFIYRLEHSKTQQAGPNATATPDKPVLGRAGSALAAWLTAADITEGPLFRRLWGERVGPALSPKAVAAIVQRRALQAGLTGDFGGHSLRSGFITEGARQGIALPALMALTEHRSVAQAIGYFQAGNASSNPASRLLDL
ncbi:integrase [Xanthomonas arboricola]|uniref:site-specific integrase n=1 Tax=Xanthomonas cannabis TaxID=1885674 RepID=UPI0017BB7AF0|nr:site-specific integrase [Xanthomonas cannabis]MBB3802276.1 integrase [Xanthomonas cannabis]